MTEIPVCPICKGAGTAPPDALGQWLLGIPIDGMALPELRTYQTGMRRLLPLVDEALRSADEKELAEAKAKVAEIEARIGLKPPPPLATSSLPPNDETDAGGGYGEAALEGQTVEAFRDELKSLRAHARAKRLRSQ